MTDKDQRERLLAILMEDIAVWNEAADFLERTKGAFINISNNEVVEFPKRAEYYRGLANERKELIKTIRREIK